MEEEVVLHRDPAGGLPGVFDYPTVDEDAYVEPPNVGCRISGGGSTAGQDRPATRQRQRCSDHCNLCEGNRR